MNYNNYNLNTTTMKRYLFLFVMVLCGVSSASAQLSVDKSTLCPSFAVDGKTMITTPAEGLWGVATSWKDDWMSDWVYASPQHQEQSGEWTILSGEMTIGDGVMFVRDSYRQLKDGLVQCRRRYEWRGKQTLEGVNLSVRWRMQGDAMQTFIPGVLYYGNKNGAKVNPNIIPVYNGQAGEFAIFEDHRYPIPFVMLENVKESCAAALHTTPSPVRGAVLSDQWWSMGVEAGEGYTDFVLYTGPIGYNGKHSVAKALQHTPMAYGNTYINMEPGRIVEKEFYVELYPIQAEGTGFQRPIYTALDIYKPYDANAFTDFQTIVEEKYRFAKNRWIDFGNGAVGFDMYEPTLNKEIVMGWCGQAASPGYALQVLSERLDELFKMLRSRYDFVFIDCTPSMSVADAIICDVPCSGMGVIRKKPDVRYKDGDHIKVLPPLQLSILENAGSYLKPGGRLVYSTCTVLKEENEAVVEKFLAAHPDFSLEPFDLPGIGRVEEGMLTLWPHIHGTDGFFMAKLVKARG